MPPKGIMIAKVCENPACAKQMQVWPSRAEKKRFCSVVCMKAMHLSKVCERPGCDVAFTCWPSRAARQYCSVRCRNIVNSEKAKLVPSTNDKIGRFVPAIIEAYLSGVSAPDLAAQYGVSPVSICARLKRAGIEPRDGGNQKPWNAEMRQKRTAYHRTHRAYNYRDLPMDEIKALYEGGMSAARVGAVFGVHESPILERLAAAGITIRQAGYSAARMAKDGHVVQSSLEEAIDDWLFAHGIDHEVHPPCPWVKMKLGQHHADFRVDDTYIEVWGILRDTTYHATRAKKIALYAACGVRLIQIEPRHVLKHDYSPLDCLLPH